MEPERRAQCQMLSENMQLLERQRYEAQDRLRAAEIEVSLAKGRLSSAQTKLQRIQNALDDIGYDGVACIDRDLRSCLQAAVRLSFERELHEQETAALERDNAILSLRPAFGMMLSGKSGSWVTRFPTTTMN
jgi:hypothetical protein